jgi:hypothetical protein
MNAIRSGSLLNISREILEMMTLAQWVFVTDLNVWMDAWYGTGV